MDQRIDRRAFLRGSAAAVVSAAWAPPGVGADEPEAGAIRSPAEADPTPIVDTHQHLWDLDRYRLPWVQGNALLERSYTMDDYLEAARGLGIVKTVYMEVAVEDEQLEAEADHVVGVCRSGRTPMVGAVIGGRPATANFGAYLDRFRDGPAVKGVRQVLHGETPAGFCLEPPFLAGIRLLGERGLSFDVCVRHGEINDAARMARACPGTSFVLDHCGNPRILDNDHSAWRADISRLAERPNVACKVSGIAGSLVPGHGTVDVLAPFVNHVLDAFGPDRVVFGGDWPVCLKGATLRQWVEALQAIVRNRPEAERRKLFSGNAPRIYRL